MKAAEYCQVFDLALLNKVVKTKTASSVLLPFLKPNCSCPTIPSLSAMSVILVHILAVISRRMFEGTVIGRYIDGCKESPPYKMITTI